MKVLRIFEFFRSDSSGVTENGVFCFLLLSLVLRISWCVQKDGFASVRDRVAQRHSKCLYYLLRGLTGKERKSLVCAELGNTAGGRLARPNTRTRPLHLTRTRATEAWRLSLFLSLSLSFSRSFCFRFSERRPMHRDHIRSVSSVMHFCAF